MFKKFRVVFLMNHLCNFILKLLDLETIDDVTNNRMTHVYTMNIKIIHHHELKEPIILGTIHILLRNINIHETIQVVVDIFVHVCLFLNMK